jgi:hypothetical protein
METKAKETDRQLVARLVDQARVHFSNEQAALTCVYMAIMSLDPDRQGPQNAGSPAGRPP